MEIVMMTLRKLCCFLVLIVIGIGCDKSIKVADTPPDDPRRYTESRHGLSYLPPDGWKLETRPEGLRIARGEVTDGIAPYIMIDDGLLPESFDKLIVIRRLDYSVDPSNKKYSEVPFQTDAGLKGSKFVFERKDKTRMQMYVLDGRSRYIQFQCAASVRSGDKFDQDFDSAVKSLWTPSTWKPVTD